MRQIIIKTKSGFTLIETFVAVTILTIAIIGPLQIFSQSIADATYSKYQVTAFYLAAEGLDAVVNKKDNNVRLSTEAAPTSWNDGLTQANVYDVDVTKEYNDANFFVTGCPALVGGLGGCYLVEDSNSGLYKSQSSASVVATNKRTPYRRRIEISAAGTDQLKIVSAVTWQYKEKTRVTSLTTYISAI